MTQHLRELLDRAVVHVDPRETDPVPVVLRRVRNRRKRKATAYVLAVALLIAGAAVSWPAVSTTHEVPTASPITGPAPTPRLIDGQIVAAGIRIPVPPGWTVAQEPMGCAPLVNHVVLIAGPDDIGCTTALIEIRARPARPVRSSVGGELVTVYPPLSDPRVFTLAGGEPGWLTAATTSERYAPKPRATYLNLLWLPWSQLQIVLRIDGEAQRSFLNSIQSTPRPAGRLAIGMDPASAALIVPGESLREPLTNRDTIAALLALLQRQEAVSDGRQACATQEHETAVLILEADYLLLREEQRYTLIVITLAENCHEAISSEGGRVRLSPEAMEKLKQPFGNRAQ